MSIKTITRYHDFCYGHRVCGHENKCAKLHGHNGRVHFTCTAPEMDSLGRIIDFSVMKSMLCDWVEDNWDHNFLMYDKDPLGVLLNQVSPESIVYVPFNPTAENMAEFLLQSLGNMMHKQHNIQLIEVRLEETRKCSATVQRDPASYPRDTKSGDLFAGVR